MSTQLSPLRSRYTSNLPEILASLASSLIVTTYQAGKVVLLRADDGSLNTHFRGLAKPMGLAIAPDRLAIGTATGIIEYRDVPAAASRIKPEGQHDSAWIPRRENVTGNVLIHEMAWVQKHPEEPPELWFVNTAFSCLATRSDEYSFEPQWRPTFVSGYSPGDRCHLNGLAEVDGRVKYVTALGETDEPGSWRQNKRDGGLLIDVEANEIVARGLSMPHSPRWHRGKLWILNSGTGGFGTLDPATGLYDEMVQLDGFTRGLCFAGPLAFIGLSQVRESATFSGIPLVERLQENQSRRCGVWVINIETAQVVGFCQFEDAVQEIFAVGLLAGCRFPDLVHEDPEVIATSYVLPESALRDVPEDLRDD